MSDSEVVEALKSKMRREAIEMYRDIAGRS